MTADAADPRDAVRQALLAGLLDEYGEDAETWTAMRSLDRLTAAVLAALDGAGGTATCDRGCEQGATDPDCAVHTNSGRCSCPDGGRQGHSLGSGECVYADSAGERGGLSEAIETIHQEAYPGAGWCAGCHDSAAREQWPCRTILAPRTAPPTSGTEESGLRAAVREVWDLHAGMHKCGGDFWTDNATYRGTIANVGHCPTRAALADHAAEGSDRG